MKDTGYMCIFRTKECKTQVPDGTIFFRLGVVHDGSLLRADTELLFSLYCHDNIAKIWNAMLSEMNSSPLFLRCPEIYVGVYSGEVGKAMEIFLRSWQTFGGDYDWEADLKQGLWYGKSVYEVDWKVDLSPPGRDK